MPVKIDENLCIGCGTCVAICPQAFKLNKRNKAEVIGEADCVRQAAEACPEGAITIEE